ncbi:isoleucine--tRNA ligase, cytoplasmic-like [Oppia nitens]|uniref:isoleucine--tRNA ligase, cytoplasmic-like n=1 Tax=Oppia nitens TaxID=1686743 RepID=UPI0023DB4C6E|nr:isoleucine--tRNA ligase, cytoplasmic-like [Oppia nitens]
MVTPVPESIDFAKEEEKVLSLWKSLNAFETSLKQSSTRPRYVFFDGPPFATGLPHYGHILAGTIKDIIPRWAHMEGHHVERRFGWDTHGLPVEYEIDKKLNIKSPDDVYKMGIKAYNDECRKIVMRYASDWEQIVTRLGRWIDFKNDYKTLYPSYMESVWWVFKQIFNKGLVYRGVKVMPYSSACNTPLSNFESGLNYKEVVDPAIIVSFPLDESPDVSLIAWTTTPWTLPSNLLLCVHPELDYVKVKETKTGAQYILMEARLEALYKKPQEYTVLEKFKGKTLEHKSYKPLFPYFEHLKENHAFIVACDTYVTAESGTGVVQCAPYFGEDDYRVALNNGVIKKDGDVVCPLDASCKFVEPVVDYLGVYVKDADKDIIKHLKSIGRLVNNSTVKHSYPFCWRSETPLIYRAISSWFIRVEHMNNALLESNASTYWVPDFVKEKRFGNWLREARDWSVSRNRYWGTPIPLWMSDDGEEVVCIGSIEELEQLSGQKITDLHRENVDPITIPSQLGKGNLTRVTEVFDCWFESGSMPYAQSHYPFENRKIFEDNFPADFVAEGVDQTRGWFYTLVVLGTILFGKPPFKNLICNGLVLAADGQKMSKSKKNYPDPMDVVNKYGADALRLYLINSPIVRAENLRFREEGVRDILKDVFLPWYNAYRFLVQNIEWFEKQNNQSFVYDQSMVLTCDNVMDKWISSFTQSLVRFVKSEMKAYRLYTVVPRLIKFVDNLTNWYVRMNRKRIKGDYGKDDTNKALHTLFSVLMTMIEMMAPFTPFLTEHMYQNLKNLISDKSVAESVHYLLHSPVREEIIDEIVERQVSCMQSVIEVGRVLRDRKTLPLKYPLPDVVIVSKDETILNDVKTLERYILDELNVREIIVTTEKDKYGIQLKAEPDIKALGLRLRNESKAVIKAIKELTDIQLQSYQNNPNEFEITGHQLVAGDIRIQYTFGGDLTSELSDKYVAESDGDILVLLNVKPDSCMMDEGISREIINRIQKLRKKAQLVPSDDVTVYYKVDESGELYRIIKQFNEFIGNTLKAPIKSMPVPNDWHIVIEDKQTIKDETIEFIIGSQNEKLANNK